MDKYQELHLFGGVRINEFINLDGYIDIFAIFLGLHLFGGVRINEFINLD